MRRRTVITGLAGLMLATLAWVIAQVAPAPQSLARYFPGAALVYLESRNFSSLLADWNGSQQKALWVKSANHEVFSRSRLFLRLTEAQTEFADAARIAPDMSLVSSVAGAESAIAIYDIGKLEFLYITRLPSATALTTALWQTRTSYETRSSAGKEYFVRSSSNGRVAAFASSDGYLLLATREDLIASALALVAGQGQGSLLGERWYDQAVKSAGGAADVRLALNLPELVKSPHFRSYWVQRNTSELKQYSAGIVDLYRQQDQWREERAFIRDQAGPSRAAEEADMARVLALSPDTATLTRAWARPGADEAVDLLRRKIMAPGIHAAAPLREAPSAASVDGVTGDEADLETRIDQPPLPAADQADIGPIRTAIERVGLAAMVHIQNSRPGPDGTFISTDTALGLLGAADWPTDLGSLLPQPAYVRVTGRLLLIANTDAMLNLIAARSGSSPAAAQGIYFARYRHAAELPHYERMMAMIDRSRSRPELDGSGEPPFFSANVGSLGRVVARVQSETVTTRDDGTIVRQQVVYRLTP